MYTDFIRRNIYRPTETDATKRNPTPVTTGTKPYLKGASELDLLTDSTALQHSCNSQTYKSYNYVTTLADQRERQGRTQQQTGSSLQDQMLRLPGFLHW